MTAGECFHTDGASIEAGAPPAPHIQEFLAKKGRASRRPFALCFSRRPVAAPTSRSASTSRATSEAASARISSWATALSSRNPPSWRSAAAWASCCRRSDANRWRRQESLARTPYPSKKPIPNATMIAVIAVSNSNCILRFSSCPNFPAHRQRRRRQVVASRQPITRRACPLRPQPPHPTPGQRARSMRFFWTLRLAKAGKWKQYKDLR